jgi:hypothetical protein
MAALFESSTSGGLFFDAAASGAYGDDLDFNYLLSQVGVFDSPASDDSLFSSTLLDGTSSTALAGELSWHVEWFDSSNDIVDLPSYDSSPRSEAHDHVRHSVPEGTNDRTTPQNIKQTEATATGQKKAKAKSTVQKGRLTEIPQPSSSETSFINDATSSSDPQDSLSFDLTHEQLQAYSDAFLNVTDEQAPATISPSLLLRTLTPPPSSPLTEAAELTVTTPANKKSEDSKDKDTKDKAAMDYAFFQFNSPSEFYIPDNTFNYPLTPGYTPTYMDPNAYVIDMAKSHSEPSYPIAESTPKKRRRAPEPLMLTPPMSNKRKRSDDDAAPVQQVAPEQYKRPRLQGQFSPMDHVPSFGSTPSTLPTTTFEPVEAPTFTEPNYQYQSDFTPYETLMSCYSDQVQYDHYAVPQQSPYQVQFQQDQFHTPPVSPFEQMGWYAPQRPYMQKTQPTVWNTPRTLPQQYPISPAPTPQKKQKDLRRLSLAPQPPRMNVYPLSPPHSAPPYPITQQHHLLPKLDPYDAGLPVTPPKKDGKKGRKGRQNNGGGMFINFTADDKETILSGVAPSGSSKAKKEKKGF